MQTSGLGARLQRGGSSRGQQLPERLTLLATEEAADLIDGHWTNEGITMLA